MALALGLALLLAGIFVVPLAHFWPQFAKDGDPAFASAQPLRYLLHNFVLNDAEPYRAGLLGNQPFPYLYINYIGWIPLLFALLGLLLARRADRRALVFLLLALGGVLITAGAAPFRVLALLAPGIAATVRNPSLISGLATPLLVALAAYGVERVLRLRLSGTSPAPRLAFLLRPLLFLLLLWSLAAVYSFNRQWLTTPRRDAAMQRVFELLRTNTTRWVALPYGRHSWVAPALDAGLKLTDVVRPWRWAERSTPPPSRRTTTELQPGYQASIGDLYVIAEPAVNYAAVRSGTQTAACSAHARGGNIDVECRTAAPGMLELYEHSWSGWRATRDGVAIPLQAGEWLRVEAPAGTHRYSFRYRPWDAGLGALLSVAGILLAVWLWWRAPQRHNEIGAPPVVAALDRIYAETHA